MCRKISAFLNVGALNCVDTNGNIIYNVYDRLNRIIRTSNYLFRLYIRQRRKSVSYLSNINGLMDYIESGNYDRIKMEIMINGYYDSLIDSNPENERYRIGWYNRTKTMLDIFFDGDYGSMPIDAEKGKVYP